MHTSIVSITQHSLQLANTVIGQVPSCMCMPIIYFQSFYCTAGEDFNESFVVVTFRPRSPFLHEPWCTNISLVDDYAVETVEYFTVALSTSDHSVDLHPNEANVTVTDGDGKLTLHIHVVDTTVARLPLFTLNCSCMRRRENRFCTRSLYLGGDNTWHVEGTQV